ncbi:hypothetical protein [Dehalococcoides mccartyi]|uniref:Uncharacterized protein n=1 Tax=Dehalococcoides mccartyi (strain VS) TaxID=311424 RepID=D2BGF8_DEHMV|nr:hypothetical protein [Dehalococcoides mccartyi]ACZ61408.1 hypothetical protein DhcVS_246 [Dehalococcoides mccartyi VS]
MEEINEIKDSIPRVRVDQLLDVLSEVASSTVRCSFDQVRNYLYKTAKRKAPPSREASWTVARDVLSDLQRFNFLKSGPLPRKRSEVDRLRETPCEITDSGSELARLYREKRAEAFNKLLIAWMSGHPYFRTMNLRLLRGPMYIPDITGIKQLGKDLTFPPKRDMLGDRIKETCSARLKSIEYPEEKITVFLDTVEKRLDRLGEFASEAHLDAKKLVDIIEDNVVVPALLESESLFFDSITLQHLIGCAQDFYSASVTSSYPGFTGRVLFSTCDFSPDPTTNPAVEITDVIHHGRSLVSDRFADILLSSYKQLASPSMGYVDIYALRALVCVKLKIQPVVFALCLEQAIEEGLKEGTSIYTELPFNPHPTGETYVEIRGKRIGMIKLTFTKGG